MDYWCRLGRKFIHCFGAQQPRRKMGMSYSLGFWALIFRARINSFHARPSLLIFFSLFVLFHSFCSHSQVFGNTLVHEFPISYSHTKYGTRFFRHCNYSIRCESTNTDALVNQQFQTNFNQSMMPNDKKIYIYTFERNISDLRCDMTTLKRQQHKCSGTFTLALLLLLLLIIISFIKISSSEKNKLNIFFFRAHVSCHDTE